ncbi:MAG: rhodanese-like domain-containing protein [Armatimonadetes bacterium]|nr:rhodanese-like domain-containing protein [Armatimonadota bacterium]
MKRDIEPKELQRRLASGEHLRIIDVRTPSEFAAGHIPGALNIPLSEMKDEIPGLAAGDQVVFVCRSGKRSVAACQKLANQPDVLNLAGGTMAWKAAGLEIESPPQASRRLDRQTHFVAGLLLLAAFGLSLTVSPGWIYLALLPTFGLMLDALTGICPMTLILKRMPWNAPTHHGHTLTVAK